ncbi:hypothetical protein H0E87_031596, partial [Populus deltoides]
RVPERFIEESLPGGITLHTNPVGAEAFGGVQNPLGGLPEVSHCTPIQLVQKPLEDTLEQPDGKGFRELASFSMTATSLAVTDERMRRKLR